MSTILTIALFHLAGVLSPGANFLIVTHNSLCYSRRNGLLTARGVVFGSLTYITIGLLGFATVIVHSSLLFNLFRLVGAAYFIYAGSRAFSSIRKGPVLSETAEPVETLSGRQAFVGGLLTALSNPTSILYFVAMFTGFLPESASGVEKALTALVLVSISFTWYTLVAMTFSHERVRSVYRHFERWIKGLIGVLWIALAIKLLLS